MFLSNYHQIPMFMLGCNPPIFFILTTLGASMKHQESHPHTLLYLHVDANINMCVGLLTKSQKANSTLRSYVSFQMLLLMPCQILSLFTTKNSIWFSLNFFYLEPYASFSTCYNVFVLKLFIRIKLMLERAHLAPFLIYYTNTHAKFLTIFLTQSKISCLLLPLPIA